MKYKIGDIVQVKIYQSEFYTNKLVVSRDGSKNSGYDLFSFKIIGMREKDFEEYLLDISINSNMVCFYENEKDLRNVFNEFNVSDHDRKTLYVVPVEENGIISVIKQNNGMNCKICNTFNEYVTIPNQSDGTYKCYSCRI